LDATDLWLRRALGFFFGQRTLPAPSMNEDEAIAIAQRYAVEQGWGEIEHPYGVWTAARGAQPEQWEIRSYNPSGLGAATRVAIDCQRSTVLNGGRIRR
jgi:hypothetical protein